MDGAAAIPSRAAFAHASEAEMARILDFYQVRWEYEPVTFPILWNQDGDVVESFSPDFYLPEFDVFLEMTTLKQRLVRKKNRKLRRLRELYPDIQIKLFYARDFRAIMLKYGRLGLVESLSGTVGQVVPERAASAAALEPVPGQVGPPPPLPAEVTASEEPHAVPLARRLEPSEGGGRRRTRSGAERRRRRRAAEAARAALMVEADGGRPDGRDEEERSER
jgi:hypothetical protein